MGLLNLLKKKKEETNIIIVLDSSKLENQNLDIRYLLPQRIEEFTNKDIENNGYEYLSETKLAIFLKTPNARKKYIDIVQLINNEKFLENDLSKYCEIYISSSIENGINNSTKVYPNSFDNMRDEDTILVNLFGKFKEVKVFSKGDNRFTDNGDFKEPKFELSKEEVECLKMFVENVDISNYKKEIVDYCNEQYGYCGAEPIKQDELKNEIDIDSIVINITKNWKSKDGFVYPEISFYGECECDPENGICIAFRNKKFLGIGSQRDFF